MMFFDLKFWSASSSGRRLQGHFPCVPQDEIESCCCFMDDNFPYEVVDAVVITEVEIHIPSQNPVEVIRELLP